MRELGLTLAILMCGCATTTFGSPRAPGTERWIRERTSFGQVLRFESNAGALAWQRGTLLESTVPGELRFKLQDDQTVRIEQVREIVAVRRARGTLEGALMGAAAGIAIGLAVGLSHDLTPYERSGDCTIVCSRADAAKLDGAVGGGFGLLLGAGIGALVGHRDVLELE